MQFNVDFVAISTRASATFRFNNSTQCQTFPRNGLRVITTAWITGALRVVVPHTDQTWTACLSKIFKRYASCNVCGRP
jgi:hypothetical protein